MKETVKTNLVKNDIRNREILRLCAEYARGMYGSCTIGGMYYLKEKEMILIMYTLDCVTFRKNLFLSMA